MDYYELFEKCMHPNGVEFTYAGDDENTFPLLGIKIDGKVFPCTLESHDDNTYKDQFVRAVIDFTQCIVQSEIDDEPVWTKVRIERPGPEAQYREPNWEGL